MIFMRLVLVKLLLATLVQSKYYLVTVNKNGRGECKKFKITVFIKDTVSGDFLAASHKSSLFEHWKEYALP